MHQEKKKKKESLAFHKPSSVGHRDMGRLPSLHPEGSTTRSSSTCHRCSAAQGVQEQISDCYSSCCLFFKELRC